LKAIQHRTQTERQGAFVVAINLPASNFSIKMDKQNRLRQAEQNNIQQAFIDHDARLQQAFANAKNPKPILWIRTPHGWTISRDD
jgi:hypothetical protein